MPQKAQHTTQVITDLIVEAREKAIEETEYKPGENIPTRVEWPVAATIGPGLEGAIACESEIGYVNGSKGWLIYRGYDIFELCAYSTYEEVSYLLLHGELPTESELTDYKGKLREYRICNDAIRSLMSFSVEKMHPMAGLRLGTNLMRQSQTYRDQASTLNVVEPIATDEDSIAMETLPIGGQKAIYEFASKQYERPITAEEDLRGGEGLESCYHLIAGVTSVTAAIARIHDNQFPIEPDPSLSHAANLLYMMNGKVPSALDERIMDICLILHADHGMNASTFAAMVVASTLSDIYFSIGSGIAALNGPLHGGANEAVMKTLATIGSPDRVDTWFQGARERKEKVMGFGHRVYKAYDPRARILGPLAEMLVTEHADMKNQFATAKALEKAVVDELGQEKKIFPNVDFYSGLVYSALGIPTDFFTPLFAVSRVAGWTSRVLEYLQHNRIFRPRGIYTGEYDKRYKEFNKG